MLPLERKCLFVRLLPGIDLLFLPNPLQHRPHGISDSVFLQIIPGFFRLDREKQTSVELLFLLQTPARAQAPENSDTGHAPCPFDS